MMSSIFNVLGAIIISDYVPFMSFFDKLQGYVAKFEKVPYFKENLAKEIFDLHRFRRCAFKDPFGQWTASSS